MQFYAHTASNEANETLYSFNKHSDAGEWQGTAQQFFDSMGRRFSGVDLAEDQSGWQSPEEHLRNVAGLAAGFVRCIGLADAATALGWLHDLGKYNPEFQRYLRGLRGKGEDTRHAIHGAALLLSQPDRALVQAVAGHHAGLYDWSNLESGARMFGLTPPLQSCYETWKRETGAVFALSGDVAKLSPSEAELRTRMVFSALVDADRLDIERHQRQNRSGEVLRSAAMPVAEMAGRLEAHLDGLRSAPAGSPVPELTGPQAGACVETSRRPTGAPATWVAPAPKLVRVLKPRSGVVSADARHVAPAPKLVRVLKRVCLQDATPRGGCRAPS